MQEIRVKREQCFWMDNLWKYGKIKLMMVDSSNQSGYLSVLFVLQPLPEFSLKRNALPAFDMICFHCCYPLKLPFQSLGCLWKVSCHRMKAGVWWQIQICLWRGYLRHLTTLWWCFPPTFYKCLGASSIRPLTSKFSGLHKMSTFKIPDSRYEEHCRCNSLLSINDNKAWSLFIWLLK